MANLLFKNYQVNLIDNGYILNYKYVTQASPQERPDEQQGTRHFNSTQDIDAFILSLESPVLLADPKILLQ